jgi:hypothetical protein
MKAVSSALVVVASITLATQGVAVCSQETQAKQKQIEHSHVPRSGSLVDRYFPFRVGQTHSYSVRGESAEGSGQNVRVVPIRGAFSETVLSVQSIAPAMRVIEVRVAGDAPDYKVCASKSDQVRSSAWTFWYVVHNNRVFSECTREDVDALLEDLRSPPSSPTSVDNLEYQLPLKAGNSWGHDPASPKRTDTFYEWFVEAKAPVEVPSGKYDDCYRMAYRTLPDHIERWVCSGVGLVAEEYTHHGWVHHYRIELTKLIAAGSSTKQVQ